MDFIQKRKPIFLGTEIYSRLAQSDLGIAKALQMGTRENFLGVDAAECYGDGSIEKAIGDFLHSSNDNFKVCTKFGHVNVEGSLQESFSAVSVKQQLKLSLKHLARSSIDVYYFHSGSNAQFLQTDMWDYLQLQKTRGVIKNLGLSLKHELVKNRDNVQIKQASKFGISVVQTVFNPLNQQSLEYVIHSARTEGLKIIGRMPLSKGLIPKMSIEDLEQIISPDSEVKELITEYWDKCKFGKNSLPVAVKIGLTLNWCLKQVDAVVLAHSSIDQLVMNSRVIEAISFKD